MATISRMNFGVGVVRDFLEVHGHVVTVRGYDYRTRTATVPQLNHQRITRRKLGEIKNLDDLAVFLPISGFSDLAIWTRQIKAFCKDGRMFVYLVKLTAPRTDRPQQQLNFEQPLTATDPAPLREDNAPTPAEEYSIYADALTHPTDVTHDPAIRDPALIDLAKHRAVAQLKRDADARRETQRRQRQQREQHNEQLRAAIAKTHRQTPAEIMTRSPAELFLCSMARGV